MSYDCELTGNLAQLNEKKTKNPEQETNVNQSYQETDDTNAIQQNRMKGRTDRLQMQNTLTCF